MLRYTFNYSEFIDTPTWIVIFTMVGYAVAIIYGYVKCVIEGKKYKKFEETLDSFKKLDKVWKKHS